MKALADATNILGQVCHIFERMIDSVPAAVVLAEPIEAVDIKPYFDKLALKSDGTIEFLGRIRVRVDASTGRGSNDMAVTLSYTNRGGKVNSGRIDTTQARLKGGQSQGMLGEVFQWFEFSTTLDAEVDISKLNVKVRMLSTSKVSVYDNAGHGFPGETSIPGEASIFYQPDQSCMNTSSGNGTSFATTILAAIHKGYAAKPVTLDLVHSVEGLLDYQSLRPEARGSYDNGADGG